MAKDVAMLVCKADEIDDFVAICEDFFDSAAGARGNLVFDAGENEQRRIERTGKGVCMSKSRKHPFDNLDPGFRHILSERCFDVLHISLSLVSSSFISRLASAISRLVAS